MPSGRRWRNGLALFHGLELCSSLEMLLRSRCLTELEPELVVEALVNCPAFANNGLILFLNIIKSFYQRKPNSQQMYDIHTMTNTYS